MPKIWNCHKGIDENIEVNEAPFIKNGYLTFGCFNNSSKISENCINVWTKIFNNIKHCRLIIKASTKDSEIAQKKSLKNLKKTMLIYQELFFVNHKKDKINHLKTYQDIDISLDTFPYPGVTTSFESIWMGVPVLTKKRK